MTAADQIAELEKQRAELVPVKNKRQLIDEINRGFGLDVRAVRIRIKHSDAEPVSNT